MKFLKFAAIDIGSNAVRLLVSNVFKEKKIVYYKKSSLIRIPLRLGNEAFKEGKISTVLKKKLVDTMIAFDHLMKAQEVIGYRGAATSAMREASNGKAIVKEIKKKSGLNINIIDGQEEARILFSTHVAEQLNGERVYLYVDVGGGSTELSIFFDGQQEASASFNIGTLRILNRSVKKKDWNVLRNWVEENSKIYKPSAIIGSGGNINRAFKMTRTKEGKFLTQLELALLKKHIESHTIKERIVDLDMRPDRADVIVHALSIFLNVMDWSGNKRIFVPKMGLSDGLIRLLYEEHS